MTQDTISALMGVLEAGGSLRYFYLDGGVAVHDMRDKPIDAVNCSMSDFLDLRSRGIIDQTEREGSCWPQYASNQKNSVYKLVKK